MIKFRAALLWDFLLLDLVMFYYPTDLVGLGMVEMFFRYMSHWWGGLRPPYPDQTIAQPGIGSRPSPVPTDAALVGRPSPMGPISGASTDTSPIHTSGRNVLCAWNQACLDRLTYCTWWSCAPPCPRPTLYTWCWRPTRLHLSSTTVDSCRGTIAGPRLPRRTCCRWPHCMSSAAAVG